MQFWSTAHRDTHSLKSQLNNYESLPEPLPHTSLKDAKPTNYLSRSASKQSAVSSNAAFLNLVSSQHQVDRLCRTRWWLLAVSARSNFNSNSPTNHYVAGLVPSLVRPFSVSGILGVALRYQCLFQERVLVTEDQGLCSFWGSGLESSFDSGRGLDYCWPLWGGSRS